MPFKAFPSFPEYEATFLAFMEELSGRSGDDLLTWLDEAMNEDAPKTLYARVGRFNGKRFGRNRQRYRSVREGRDRA